MTRLHSVCRLAFIATVVVVTGIPALAVLHWALIGDATPNVLIEQLVEMVLWYGAFDDLIDLAMKAVGLFATGLLFGAGFKTARRFA